ncbi:MAG: diguanylate cyclase [Chloroflexota bacterium]
MQVPSERQSLAPGPTASSARTEDPAPHEGRLVPPDLVADVPMADMPVADLLLADAPSADVPPTETVVVGADGPPSEAPPAESAEDRETRGPVAKATRKGGPLATSLPTTLLAVVALLAYAAVRAVVEINDPLEVGLASVPLFFAAAFLTARRALMVGLGTIAVTLLPIALYSTAWTITDTAIVAQLATLALAATVLRAAMLRAARSAARSAARETAHEALLTDRLEAVLGIAERLTTTLDRDAILQTIVTEVNRALETDGTTIRILRDDQAVVVASAGIGQDVVDRLPALGKDEAWFGQLVRDRRPIVDDGFARPIGGAGQRARVIDAGSSIAVPLIIDDRVIGSLTAFTNHPRSWSAPDIEFAVAVTTHAALAIHNADLFAQTKSWAGQLAVLQAASGRMTRQNTLASVGRAIVEEVGKVIDYHNCRVYLIEEPDDMVPIAFEGRVGAYEIVDMALLRTKVGEGFTGWVAATGEPLLVGDAMADPRGAKIAGTDDIDESMICVPMRYDERIIGVITLSKLGLRQFDRDDLRLLSILADQAATAVESARLLSRSDRLASELRRLLDMSSALAQSLDPREVAMLIAEHMVDAMGVDECAISWWDRPGDQLLTMGHYPPVADDVIQPVFELKAFPETRRVLAQQVTVIVRVGDPDADPAEVAYLRSEGEVVSAMLPLVAKGRSIGLVELMSRTDVVLDQPALELASTMANEAAMALENARHYQDARELADRDQLTGFYNHRYLHQRLGEEIVRAQRSKSPLALLMIDLDDFKLVNDTFGHQFGDRVLAWSAEQIRSTLRISDVSARYGGDEFAIILPDTDREAAGHAADRIVAALRERPFESPDRGSVPIDASIGVAAFPVDGRTGRELIATADVEMYRVKLASGTGSPATSSSGASVGRHEPVGVRATPGRARLGLVRTRGAEQLEEADPIAD